VSYSLICMILQIEYLSFRFKKITVGLCQLLHSYGFPLPMESRHNNFEENNMMNDDILILR